MLSNYRVLLFSDKLLLPIYMFFRLLCVQSGILNDIFNAERYWKSRKYLQSNLWLQNWLRREIQALMQVVLLVGLV